jgi:hypothetical protein
MVILGIALLVLYLLFWAWHSPWAGKLTGSEIDHYLSVIERIPDPCGGPQGVYRAHSAVGRG